MYVQYFRTIESNTTYQTMVAWRLPQWLSFPRLLSVSSANWGCSVRRQLVRVSIIEGHVDSA